MVTKALEICDCLVCPYVSIDNYIDEFVCCNGGDTRVITSVNDTPTEIPQWCPLEDYRKS